MFVLFSLLFSGVFLLNFINVVQLQRVTSPPTPPHWDYEREGPDVWHHLYDQCEGESQSPINIRTSQLNYNADFGTISLNGYNNMSTMAWNFTHNGHTIVATPIQTNRLSINGVGLPNTFSLLQFHLHWGLNPYQGSEHTINDEKFPLEAHFVHKSQATDTLAVVGVLFELQREDNPYINDLLTVVNRTINRTTSFEQQVDVSRLFPNTPSPKFYRYNGSLTTPPCTEGVIWTILVKRIPISKIQWKVFMQNSITANFRPPRRLHSRPVIANFHKPLPEGDEEEGQSQHHSSASSKAFSTFLFSLILLFVNFRV